MAYNTQYGNQYADRVYAEHPIALWPLDEDVYYLSLIDNDNRLFSNWTLSNCTATDSPYPTTPDIPQPFDSDIFSSLTANTTSSVTIQAISNNAFNTTSISTEIGTFCINFWLYHKPTYVNWFKVGYQYTHTTLGTQTVLSDEILPSSIPSWLNFNNVYTIPENWTGYIKLVIQVNFADTSTEGDDARSVIMNGLSVGQESETSCFSSLGSTSSMIPSEIGFASTYGVAADQYGVQSGIGYYLVRNNRLLAHNDGFPIIYGTNHSTKIYPSESTLPSFIFPGKGMLHESGRNKEYSLEMWMKIDPSTTTAKRIIGPVSSNDGIWIKEGFITLVIGDEIGSHCVGEWYRPMLIHLILKENNAILLINSEQVINVELDRSSIDLPSSKDWWGVYSYSSVDMFQIDAISVYPYAIPEIVAKRRFVYGQGTPSIQTIDDNFSGTPVTIDFSTAQYSTNTIYPDIERWDAGYFDNLNATRGSISVPDYKLPIISIDNDTSKGFINQWYADNYIANTLEYPAGGHPRFVTLRPNITYDIAGDPVSWDYDGIKYVGPSYLNFPSLNILNNALAAVYGIFEVEENIADQRILISFKNITSQTSFDIVVEADEVKYLMNGMELAGATQTISIGTECLVGINFETAGIEFGYEVSQFFSSPSSIQMYVGGDGSSTFEGKIYAIGFCNQSNYQKIESAYPNNEVFLANGLTDSSNYELMINHIASYTLIPEYEYNKMFLDISVSSEWEEYYPLTRFASYVKDSDGEPYYELDMVQLNLGYASVSSTSVWKYQELKDTFTSQDYADLAASTYDTYFNLYKKNTTGDTISVADSSVQAYLTFQEIAAGANAPLSSFQYTKELSSDLVIDPDLENTLLIPDKAYRTKFIFKDNTVLYPPKSMAFEDYAMVVHLLINQRSIIKNPLRIKSLEIASKNLNYASNSNDESQRNYVGTKFGTKAYPEIDLLGQIDYKGKNPFLIHKTSTPYLYTTKKSGIKVINKTSIINPPTIKQYGVSIPVNPNGSYDFNVGALSFFILGDLPEINDEIPFLEIRHKNGIVTLILNKTDTGTSIKSYDKNETIFLDGGDASTALFTDDFDGEYSGSEASMFLGVSIGSVTESTIENVHTISFNQNGTTVDVVNDTITFSNPHGYQTGDSVVYTSSEPIIGLVNEKVYYVRVVSDVEISLYPTETDSVDDTNKIDMGGSPTGVGRITEYPYVEILGFDFYQNGRYVKSPSIKNNEWNYIGITFPTGLDFSEYSDGQIILYGGFTFNNLSYYLSDGLGIKSDVTVRVWSDVLNQNDIVDAVGDGTHVTYTTSAEHGLSVGQYVKVSGITPSSLDIGDSVDMAVVASIVDEFSFTVLNSSVSTYTSGGAVEYIWQEWSDVTWADAYVLGQTDSYVTTPSDIYAAYTGTNRDVVDDDSGIVLSQVDAVAITGASWSLYSGKPA